MDENIVEFARNEGVRKSCERKAVFIEEVVNNGIRSYIRNGTGEAMSTELNGEPILLIKDDSQSLHSCYLTSVVSQYLGYPLAELDIAKEPKFKKFFIKTVLRFGVRLFTWSGVHKVVYVDHNLCSTPTYSKNVQEHSGQLLDGLKARFPKYALVYRGLNNRSNQIMMSTLLKRGVKSVLCRRLYFLETAQPETYEKKRPLVQDQKRWKKLQEKEGLKWKGLEMPDVPVALEYYKQIYLEKYAIQNPDYSNIFIELTKRTGQLKWEVLTRQEQVLAVQGYSWNEIEINTPFIGYQQKLARELRLYPSLNVRLLHMAKKFGKRLNMSSGAAEFKRQRGGEPVFEYQFVDVSHLSLRTRLMWHFLSWYSKSVVGPYIVKHHL